MSYFQQVDRQGEAEDSKPLRERTRRSEGAVACRLHCRSCRHSRAQFLSLPDRQGKGWAHTNPSERNSRLCLRRQALKRSDLQGYFHQSERHTRQLRKLLESHVWQRCPDLHVTDRLHGKHAMSLLLDSLTLPEPA